MSQRTRLTFPIEGRFVAGLLNLLIRKFVPDFLLIENEVHDDLIEYQSAGVTIRRKRCEHSYENSDEPWWPTSHWWECEVTGVPGVAKITLSAGTSSPGAGEDYNFIEIDADESLQEKIETEWRGIVLKHAIEGRKAVSSPCMPPAWRDYYAKSRNLEFNGAFDWMREYRLALAEDAAPLIFVCEGKNWLATVDQDKLLITGALPADLKSVKETRQRHATGIQPHGLELALRLMPGESRWQELMHEETDACFLDTAWGEKIQMRAWQNGKWLMRQSIGGNKWGGLRSVYWLQPYSLAEAARFSLIAMFEIYGGGATMSYNPDENNTHYFYSVVGGINPAEKSAFLVHLDQALKADGWEKE